jgi:hypothetical protein
MRIKTFLALAATAVSLGLAAPQPASAFDLDRARPTRWLRLAAHPCATGFIIRAIATSI